MGIAEGIETALVSSAHARVHRSGSLPPPTSPRFLRARAGSPHWLPRDAKVREVPPRTRGFTVRERNLRHCSSGSSAHARVHRLEAWSGDRTCRFRRARAGSPSYRWKVFLPSLVPPRTRVHRYCRCRRAGNKWFLRARAGSACVWDGTAHIWVVAPRMRGFTVGRRRAASLQPGSSAHARVHPSDA